MAQSLQNMHRLGLLPFIRALFVHSDGNRNALSLKRLDDHIPRQVFALTNVRQLVLDILDIPSFMPRVWRYFGHFSPTVQGLRLAIPKGSRWQIIFFIGLFEHLQDLEIADDAGDPPGEPEDDPTLTPLFTPPLRGQLKLSHFRRVGLVRGMIDLFGGLRFRVLDIFNVDGVPLLLDACAKTPDDFAFVSV